MNRTYTFQKAPRCTATSKRTGRPCQAPAVRGWAVCRFHGARGGAPTGRDNGNFTGGEWTREARQRRRAERELLHAARSLMRDLFTS